MEEPLARYQHSTIFVGTLMLVLGGRTNTVGENVQLEVYETESSEWRKFNSLQRFRHSVWAIDQNVFMHGGFENETPNIPTNSIMKLDLMEMFAKTQPLLQKLELSIGKKPTRPPTNATDRPNNVSYEGSEANKPRGAMMNLTSFSNNIRIGQAEVEQQPGGKTVHMPLNNLGNDKQKPANPSAANQNMQKDTLYNLFLSHLLRPREWTAQYDGNGYFAFRREHIIALAEECQRVLEEQPMVLRVDAPVKVFGDIHGQY